MTKTSFLTFMIVGFINPVFAQQDPYYAHFMFNHQAYNPAAVGSTDDNLCISAVGHNQWLGFDDQTWVNRQTGASEGIDVLPTNVAPTTYNFNIGGQLIRNGVRLGGVGLSIIDDRIGAMKTTTVKGQVAYFVRFRNGNRISVGGEVALANFGFANPQFRPRQLFDPKIPNTGLSKSKADFSTGLFYSQPRLFRQLHSFYAGVSVQHLNQANFRLVTKDYDVTYQLKPHYYATSGVTIPSRSGIYAWKPSLLIKYNVEPQVNLNVIAERNKQYRYGLGYRQGGNSDALIAYLGYVQQALIIGYSYDITMSRINRVSAGTHEIAVKWCFQKKSTFYHKTPREM